MPWKKGYQAFQVYGLVDSLTGELRYVGCTIRGHQRIKTHLRLSGNRGRTYKEAWVRSLFRKGGHPCVLIIEEHSAREDVLRRECELIKYFRELGFRLTNLTDGGEGRAGAVVSEETRRKLSQVPRRPPSAETLRLRSEALMGHPVSEETKAKIRATKASRVYAARPELTAEQRAKLSANATARWAAKSEEERKAFGRKVSSGQRASGKMRRGPLSAETRAKMGAAKRGWVMSEAQKRQMSEARRGKKLSEEHKAALRRGQANRPPMSPETCAKIGAANRRRRLSDETKAKIAAKHLGKTISDEAKFKISEAFRLKREAKEAANAANLH